MDLAFADRVIEELLALRPGEKTKLQEKELALLCRLAIPILLGDGMLPRLRAPINIAGDIHGQFFDLLTQFKKVGYPGEVAYVFLGDYVDRGAYSIETIALLLAYKIKFPSHMTLLRGNHECSSVNRLYGFYDDCKRRYTIRLWKTFGSVFDHLPIMATVEGSILCVHGGLSPSLRRLEQIAALPQPMAVTDPSFVSDLLWSDPDNDISGWGENDRGVGYTFGPNVVSEFLREHNLHLLCRAHQVVEDGYEFFCGRKLVTLFSAPNYCGEFDNAACILSVGAGLLCRFIITKPTPALGLNTGRETGERRASQ